jgi:hypothetical protein
MVLTMALLIGWNYYLNSNLLAVSNCNCHNDDPQQQQQQQLMMDTPNSNNLLQVLRQPHQKMSVPTTTMYSKVTESTTIITISFGNATRTQLVERWMWSLRGNGDWQGNIFVLTDSATHYETVFRSDKKVHVLTAKEEDLHPVDQKTQRRLVWAKDAMRMKRFKTLLLEYLEEFHTTGGRNHNTSSSLQSAGSNTTTNTNIPAHVLYLDMEIVVARPISGLLLDYQDKMIRREIFENGDGVVQVSSPNGTTTTTTNDYFMSMFTDCPTCARRNTNGGVMMLHTQYSKPCLRMWQHLFDDRSTWAVYDQRHLRDLHESVECTIYTLPDHHRLYPNRKEMRTYQSATIVHITNTYGSLNTPEHVQRAYFEYLLPRSRFSVSIERF